MKPLVTYLLAVSLFTGAGSALAVSDEALLEDLGADLLEPAPAKKVTPLDTRLLEQLGEDVGTKKRSAQNPQLEQVVDHMQAACALLEQLSSSKRASTAQQYALTGLDTMIAELTEKKSKCSGGQCEKPGSPQPGKKQSSSKKPGQKAATAASSSTSQSAEITPTLNAASNLVKDLWGHLPERQRQQILQPLSAEFLPQYAAEIEAYFRKLAEP